MKDLVQIPLVKFINHMASQFTFLVLLINAAATSEKRAFNRSEVGSNQELTLVLPSLTEWLICMWVIGMVWNELKQVQEGVGAYFDDPWNRIDATMIILYFSTVAFRFSSHVAVRLSIVPYLHSLEFVNPSPPLMLILQVLQDEAYVPKMQKISYKTDKTYWPFIISLPGNFSIS